MYEKEVIPFGPYLKDSDDLTSQTYTTTAKSAIQQTVRLMLTLVVLLVILPVTLLIFSIRFLKVWFRY